MRIALYTTIHPGTRPFLQEWYDSVRRQTDSDFELWMGIDTMSVDEACEAMGARPEVHWVCAEADDSHARVRERAWRALIPHADAVVMVDADDVMRPGRIEHARKQITTHDVAACGLELVGAAGEALGVAMPPEEYESADDILPRYNIFGLTNTVYRTDVLEQLLPLPDDSTLIDWYLATQTWLQGKDLTVDRSVQMNYRQHESSALSFLPPFTEEDIRRTSRTVCSHFSAVESNLPAQADEDRVDQLRRIANEIRVFERHVIENDEQLREYTSALNQHQTLPLWWGCVARPELRHYWKHATSK